MSEAKRILELLDNQKKNNALDFLRNKLRDLPEGKVTVEYCDLDFYDDDLSEEDKKIFRKTVARAWRATNG